MKKTNLIIAIVFLMVLMAGCGNNNSSSNNTSNNASNNQTADKPIKLGGVFSASGGSGTLGKPQLDTIKMLVDKKNAEGGIKGRKIEFIVYDDKSDQNEAVLNVKKLMEQDKVSAIIGGTISGNALAMIPLVEKAKIPLIAVAASKNINIPVKKFIFKTVQGDDIVVPKILDYLKKNSLTNIAWLNVDNSFGSSAKEEFTAQAKNYGITAVISDVFDAAVNDAKPTLTRVKNANPQAIVIWGTTQESAVVTKNVRELGIDLPIIESHGIANANFIELAGNAANGVIFPAGRLLVVDQLSDDNKQKKVLAQYAKDFKDKFNYPASTFGGHAWDAFEAITAAIEKVGDNPEKIRDAMESDINEISGISGTFKFAPDNHNGLKIDSLSMIKIQDGKWKLGE